MPCNLLLHASPATPCHEGVRLQLQQSKGLAETLQPPMMTRVVKGHDVLLARAGHCGSLCSPLLANTANAADGLHPVAAAAAAPGYQSNPNPPVQSGSTPLQWHGLYWAATTAELPSQRVQMKPAEAMAATAAVLDLA